MDKIVVEGGAPLRGSVAVSGAAMTAAATPAIPLPTPTSPTQRGNTPPRIAAHPNA